MEDIKWTKMLYPRATAHDMEIVRPIIERLYTQKNQREIIDILMKEHGLDVTVNMLKKRVGKWGLNNKNNNERMMRAMVRKKSERSRIGKSSAFRTHGRLVQNKDIVHYWKRKHMSIEDILAQAPSRELTPDGLEVITPVPSPVSTPAVFAIPERILTGMSHYVEASFESGTWVSDAEDCYCRSAKVLKSQRHLLQELSEYIDYAQNSFLIGRSQEGGQMLRTSTAVIKELVIGEEPMVFCYILHILVNTSKDGLPEIGIAIARQFASMGQILLGHSHPVAQLCALLTKIDTFQIRDFFCRSLNSLSSCFESQLGLFHRTRLEISQIYYLTMASPELEIQEWRNSLDALEARLPKNDPRCLRIRLCQASAYISMELLDEAKENCLALLDYCKSPNNLFFRIQVLDLLALVQCRLQNYQDAKTLSREAIELVVENRGPDAPILIHYLLQLELLLWDMDQGEEAEEVEEWRKSILDKEMMKMQKAEGY